MKQRHVYFVKPVGLDGPVKIGCSDCPPNRLDQLMVWSPYPLELVASIPGSFALERNIHECFADLHSHREWFRADARITAVMDKLKAGVPINEAMDLSARKVAPLTAKALHWLSHPSARQRASYMHKLNWAERKARTDTHYYNLPDDVQQIIYRWRGWTVYRQPVEQRDPTPLEFARLDEVISDPRTHLVPHPFSRRAA